MTEGVWIALITGLLGGTTILEIIKLLKELKGGKKKYTSVFEQSQYLYDILQEGVNNTSADRGILLKTTNGGGPPKLDSPLYISSVLEVNSPNLEPSNDKYKGIEVDRDYTDMLFRLSREHFLDLKTEDLRINSTLRVAYESVGIKESFVFLIKEEKTYWFGSFSTTTSFSAADILAIKSLVIDLRRVFRVHKIK